MDYKGSFLALAAASFAAVATMSALSANGQASPGTVLLVGDKEATASSVRKALGSLGKVLEKEETGLFRVRLNPGMDARHATESLRKAGIDYVLPASSVLANQTSLTSVRNHIAYLEAKADVKPLTLTGKVPRRRFHKALEYWLRLRVGPDGKFDQELVKQAIAQRDALPPAPDPAYRDPLSTAPSNCWLNIGPVNFMGPQNEIYAGTYPLSMRKTGICVAPSNPAIIYVASATGGVWKTINSGTTWTSCSDSWPFLVASCVAVDPTNPNIVYAGIGDYHGSGLQTAGLMKSTNGGSTWTLLGTSAMRSRIISRICIDPATPNTINVGVGSPNVDGPALSGSGVYRTTDGGTTWIQTKAGYNIDDMELGIGGKLWLAGTDRAATRGIIARSADKGATWTTVAAPTTVLQNNMDIAPGRNSGTTVYALTTGNGTSAAVTSTENIWRSTNDGASWTSIKAGFPNGGNGAAANENWGQKSYDYFIGSTGVAGNDVVFVGLITLAQWNSSAPSSWVDIGKSWQEVALQHADQHCYALPTSNSSTVYFGSDGGIHRYAYSTAPTTANWVSLNASIRDIQVDAMDIHPTNPNYMSAGTQDNSTPSALGSLTSWWSLDGGDGSWPAFDVANPAIHYTSTANTSDNGPAISRFPTSNSLTPDAVDISPGPWTSNWLTPLITAGPAGSNLYAGGSVVKRWNGSLATPNAWTDVTATFGANVTTMARAPSTGNTIYVGCESGELYRTANAFASETQIDDANLTRPIGAIAAAYSNANYVVVGLKGSSGPRLWRCTNTSVGAPVWTNISGVGSAQLPDSPVNAVTFDPFDTLKIYVGTDVGCFMTVNGGSSWSNMNALGLPNVQVNSLRINAAKTLLYAGTYGRGIWKIGLAATPAYSVSGTVFDTGGTVGLADATVTLRYLKETSTSSTVSPATAIPDNSTVGVTANVATTLTTALNSLNVYVKCTHLTRGNLQVTLVAPDGRTVILKPGPVTDTADHLAAYYDVTGTFRGMVPKGTWKVVVKDLAAGTTGTFDTTTIRFAYNGYVTQSTAVTPEAGTFTFTGLAPGKYSLTPVYTGVTFTPVTRYATVGANVTAQDFTAN